VMTSSGDSQSVPRPTPDLATIVAALESMGPDGLAALVPPAPDPSLYLRDPVLATVEMRDVTIAGPHGDVLGRVYRHPTERRDTAFVWVHGGAFMGGDLDMPEAHWVSLAVAARGFGVLSVDYRKCLGGVHYPVPSDDVLAAWQWAVGHLDEVGASSGRLHLGGASAGGSLAAGVTKRLRDGAGGLPASLVLVYPTLHAELPPMSEEVAAATEALREAMPVELVRWMNLKYVGSEKLLDHPYAFPGLGDVSGQPAVYVLNSEKDVLRASGEAYAFALESAGVAVTVEYEPGTRHGHLNEPLLPAASRSVGRISAWLEAH
jgi:acetyl esterase